jgi:two-component system, LytTR family, sensor kinase
MREVFAFICSILKYEGESLPVGYMKGSSLNKKQSYWLFQILGWGAIIFVETVNYTFFIIQKFDFSYIIQFAFISLTGLLVTHSYKSWGINPTVFDKPQSHIAIKGLTDTLIISFLITVITGLPALLLNFDQLLANKGQFLINFFGQIMNIARYVVVWIIIYYLYHVQLKTSEIKEQKLLLENLAKTSELELLKSQLNPHFLFNALNSIKALVLIDQEKAREAIIKLSELLRFTLNYEKTPLINLSDEIDEVVKYLELEKIRFGNRLDVHIDLQAESLDAKVPPAMVLTLAENAIKHGITRLPDGGMISISSSISGGHCRIEVTNTGTLKVNGNSGIGLKNIHQRLVNLFGEKAEMVLKNKTEQQVSATLIYPVKYNSHD